MQNKSIIAKSTGRFINFNSAGELWNRAPDEQYFIEEINAIPVSCFEVWIPLTNSGLLTRNYVCGSDSTEIMYSSHYAPGIQKSSDFGQTWEDLALPNVSTVHKVICSSNGSVVFFYGESFGDAFVFYLSTNYGNSWNLIYQINPVYGGTACGIWVSPSGDKLLISAGYGVGIIKSENLGNTWNQLSSIQSLSTWGYEINSTPNNSVIIASNSESSSSSNTIIISKDFGVTWTNTVIDSNSDFTVGNKIALSEDGSRILAFKVSDSSQKQFICKVSNDGGITWEPSGPLPITTEETSYYYVVSGVAYTKDLSVIVITLQTAEYWISRDFGYSWEFKYNPSYFSEEYQETVAINPQLPLISENGVNLYFAEYNEFICKSQCINV